MKSVIVRGKMQLIVRPMPQWDNKPWVEIHLADSQRNSWIISFEELFHIVREIGRCEQIKYPEIWHKGRYMVAQFCYDAIMTDATYQELAKKYNLPDRQEMQEFQKSLL